MKLFLVYVLIFSFSFSMQSKADVLDHAGSSLIDGFDGTGFVILGVGALATAAAFNHDLQTQATWKQHQRMSEGAANVGDFWGMGIPAATIALGQLLFDSDKGVPATEGLLTSTAVTYGIKFGSQRSRPESDSHNSFPSGHTQIAFASATTIGMSYGWWWSVPLYSMAVFTGASRLADNAHWLSDVVAGATVGIFFGRASFKHHGGGYSAYFYPMKFQNQAYGMGMTIRF